MNRGISLLLLTGCALLAWSQTASIAPATKPDPEALAAKDPGKVVATINGKQVTAKQAVDLLKLLPDTERRKLSDLSMAVQQLYTITDLAQQAVTEKLDQQSPYKERLQVERDQVLAQAFVADKSQKSAPTTDARQYYDSHPTEFDRATISGIVVAFNAPGTPSSAGGVARTEPDAHQKADEIAKKLKTGADFAATAKTDSDDPQSSSRGGALGTLSAAAPNLPAEMKDVIFNKLQPGQVSDPVRGANAYYILKLDSRTKETFDQAKNEIEQQLKTEHDRAVSQQIQTQYKIQVMDPSFFGTNAATPTAGKSPTLLKPGASVATPPPPPPPK
ncbi:MAG TPA: peptidylprolyl isomerase [Bryobacteraceae bacterium]|jgi:parvulin-like peptidyl-prolyl isomerase|nr:peptidylprolyl isomerase [Bryobacteraceae bacterium]